MPEIRTVAPIRNVQVVSEEFLTAPGERFARANGEIAIGSVLSGRYKVIAKLGQGGMGIVYKCFDEIAGIEVALKALPPEVTRNTLEMEDIKQNFQLVAKLVHQNIAVNRMLEKDPDSGDHYLIMECAEGEDLARWLKKKRMAGNLTLEEVLPIIRQVAAALDYAHEQKIMHRDIKPGNIMINNSGMIKVLDFGLAAQIHTSMSRVSREFQGTSGTGPYMAPEQWRGRAQNAASDQYALGVMTYELLAGHLPFESSEPTVLKQAILDEEAPRIPGIPRYVQAAIDRAMSKSAQDRFRKCADFVNAMTPRRGGTMVGRVFKWGALCVAGAAFIGVCAYGVSWTVNEMKAREEERLRVRREKERLEKEAAEKKALEVACSKMQMFCKKNIDVVKNAEVEHTGSWARTFDDLKKHYELGCAALKDKKIQKAHANFTTAEKFCKWIVENLPLYRNALSLKKKSAGDRKSADLFEASVSAAPLYTAASNAFDQGEKELLDGRYKAAGSSFEKAAKQYESALAQAKKVHFAKLAAQAENAVKNEEWEKLIAVSEKIRKADPASAEKFIKIADEGLKIRRMLAAAQKNIKSERWSEALKILSDLLVISKNNPQALAWKSEVENQLKINAAEYKQKCAREMKELLVTFPAIREEILSMTLDREQSFGKYLDSLKQDFDTALQLEKDDPVKAYGCLKKAESAAKWIQKNIPLREQARNLIVTIGNKKEDADSFSASSVAALHYEQGIESYLRADKLYEKGMFADAIENFKKSAEKYEAAYTEAKKVYAREQSIAAREAVKKEQWDKLKVIIDNLRRVDEDKADEFSRILTERVHVDKLFADAQELFDLQEFDKALARVEQILRRNKQHPEALRLKREIEEKQNVGIKFVVTVEGNEVAAEIQLDGESPFRSGNVVKKLRKNQRYTGRVKYGEYVKKINFLCDWEGIKVQKYYFGKSEVTRLYRLPQGKSMVMVRIKAGSFMMGSKENETGHTNMETLHKVTLNDDFWIGQYEVTQEQYESLIDYNPSWFKGKRHPVENVSWKEANAFCEALNRYCASQLPRGYKFALPTEAQWEYACRAQTQTPLNNGKSLTASDERCYNLDDVAWYKYNHNFQGHQMVGRKAPNNWKLYDMHGNVAEWCRDGYGFYPYGDAYDPELSGNGHYRVYRGGSWKSEPVHCRSAQRSGAKPESHNETIGFRVAIVRK